MKGNLKIFAGNCNRDLAQSICNHVGVKLGECEIIKFSNDNIKVRILEKCTRQRRLCRSIVINAGVNEYIMELLIMIDAIKYAGADSITAVLPYYPYVRSDKKDEPRISITARLIADPCPDCRCRPGYDYEFAYWPR